MGHTEIGTPAATDRTPGFNMGFEVVSILFDKHRGLFIAVAYNYGRAVPRVQKLKENVCLTLQPLLAIA